jgi:hypothetical protein
MGLHRHHDPKDCESAPTDAERNRKDVRGMQPDSATGLTAPEQSFAGAQLLFDDRGCIFPHVLFRPRN